MYINIVRRAAMADAPARCTCDSSSQWNRRHPRLGLRFNAPVIFVNVGRGQVADRVPVIHQRADKRGADVNSLVVRPSLTPHQ